MKKILLFGLLLGVCLIQISCETSSDKKEKVKDDEKKEKDYKNNTNIVDRTKYFVIRDSCVNNFLPDTVLLFSGVDEIERRMRLEVFIPENYKFDKISQKLKHGKKGLKFYEVFVEVKEERGQPKKFVEIDTTVNWADYLKSNAMIASLIVKKVSGDKILHSVGIHKNSPSLFDLKKSVTATSNTSIEIMRANCHQPITNLDFLVEKEFKNPNDSEINLSFLMKKGMKGVKFTGAELWSSENPSQVNNPVEDIIILKFEDSENHGQTKRDRKERIRVDVDKVKLDNAKKLIIELEYNDPNDPNGERKKKKRKMLTTKPELWPFKIFEKFFNLND